MRKFRLILLVIALNTAFVSTSCAKDITTWFWRVGVVSSVALSFVTNPFNAEQVGFSAAYAIEEVWTPRLFIRWNWGDYQAGHAKIKLVGELAFERWQSIHDPSEKNGVINALILTPVFQLKLPYEKLHTYFEASVGATLVSKYELTPNNLNLGSYFLFADSIGFGFTFGQRNQYELATRFRHYSNNGIAYPNNGINFFDVLFSYHFAPSNPTNQSVVTSN